MRRGRGIPSGIIAPPPRLCNMSHMPQTLLVRLRYGGENSNIGDDDDQEEDDNTKDEDEDKQDEDADVKMGVMTAIAAETSCGVIKSDHWLHWGVAHILANRCSLCQDDGDDDDVKMMMSR